MEYLGIKDIAIYGTDCIADISIGDGNELKFVSAKEKYFDISVDDGTLTVRQKSRNFFYRIILRRIEFKLFLPKDFKGKLRFRNKNGGVYVNGGRFTDVELSTDNGAFELKGAACDSMRLKMSNGSVTAKNLSVTNGTAIKCRNGTVKVESVSSPELSILGKNIALSAIDITSKKFECQTSNGTIDASGITADELKLETSNGKISAAPLGDRKDYRLNLDTEHGSITVDGVAYKKLVDAAHVAKRLQAKNANGDIDIRFV
ncbi:MAG: DUF4097 domain-containing protein [Clostridiales bacterium]|nr:DUF4097 domain-containing protein [Clostridiales bacterium]